MHKPGWIKRLEGWAHTLKREAHVVYRVARDPRVPWLPRLIAFAVAAYTLSPLDLIPDFIPVLGLLDELVLVPLGLWLVFRLVPPAILAEHRRVVVEQEALPRSRLGAAMVIAWWLAGAALVGWLAWRYLAD